MERFAFVAVCLALLAGTGCGGGSSAAVCDKMIDCAGGGDKSACVDYLDDMKSKMRTEAWEAFTDCLLGLGCDELLGTGMNQCLLEAADAVPEGVADDLLAEYCGKMIDCGYLPISVGDCIEQQKAQAGSNADLIGIYKDSVLDCMESCTAALACDAINLMWQICMEDCGLIPEQELPCDHGHEENGACVCDTGWAGTWCDECAPGYVMDDHGDCVAGCGPDTCSGHGVCDDSTGEAVCTCNPGYTGDRCQDCAAGYVRVGDACQPAGGCQVDGTPCDDGQWCTQDDVCSGGVCVGEPTTCDDGIACTEDICDEAHDTCEHVGTPTPGLEGYMGDPTCSNGLDDDCDGFTDAGDDDCWLQPCDTPADCEDDGNDCTETNCDAGHCDHRPLPDGAACSGDDPCTTRFICRDAVCVSGPSDLDADGDGAVDAACPGGLDCDDGDPDIGPGAEGPRGDPTCSDGVDNDCDGLVDNFEPGCWEPFCTPEGWCWESPLPQGQGISGLWAAAWDDAWAVGQDGLILHWDGAGWGRMASPVAADWSAVHGCGPDDVWAVGQSGYIIHYDGDAWHESPKDDYTDLLEVMCVSSDPVAVWMSGARGLAMFWDGAALTRYDLDGGPYLYGLWAYATDDVWVAGRDGFVARFDGAAWTQVDVGTAQDLNALWGISDAGGDRLWAGGDGGTVIRRDGAGWTPETTGHNEEITAMWGTAPDDLWAVASWWGAIMHRTEAGWSVVASDPDVPFLYDIWGSGPADIWAVGQGGGLFHYDGGSWTSPAPTVEPLFAICAMDVAGGGVDAWAAGDVIMRYDGAQWRLHEVPGHRLRGLWCRQPEDIWAVGETAVLHWDGMDWRAETEVSEAELKAVTGLADGSSAWAVGLSGTILHHVDGVWVQEDAGVNNELNDVWAGGDPDDAQVWVAGSQGTILFWDERGWARMNSGTTESLYGIWGDGEGRVWAVGSNATVLHWAGAGWAPLTDPTLTYDYADVAGTSADDLWLAGYWNVAHWDGASWVTEELPGRSFEKITATPSGHVWLAGDWGNILHKRP